LLGRCAQAAWYLINQDVVKAHALVQTRQQQPQQQQQQRPAVSAFNRIRQLMRRGFGSDDKVAAVAAALQSCSTEGVWSMQQAKTLAIFTSSHLHLLLVVSCFGAAATALRVHWQQTCTYCASLLHLLMTLTGARCDACLCC
jgi:uncharacterized protein YoaH (UPF0181 family)